MATSGTTRNLGDSRGQVPQTFLSSPDAAGHRGDFTPEQVRKISDKLVEILGDAEVDAQRRNEKGELLNDEGLPIVDITEPISEAGRSSEVVPAVLDEEPDLLPLWAIGPAERQRRRLERERFLDLLEEEEQIEKEMEEERERQQRKQELEKRKDAAKQDLDRLKAARELQKKMGKALLRNVAEARERETKELDAQMDKDMEIQSQKKAQTLKPRKSVTFADDVEHKSAERSGRKSPYREDSQIPDLGDVSLARLRLAKHSPPDPSRMRDHPMKMNIVERFPVDSPHLSHDDDDNIHAGEGDSDDESVPGSPVPADSDEGDIIHSEMEDENDSEQEVVLEDEYDMDTARHQREVALEYYEKRSTIGADAKQGLTSHIHSGEHEWDQPEVPQEATLSSPAPKPSISRFKANRMDAYSAASPSSSRASTSIGPSVLPASRTPGLQRSVKTGKLQGGKLFGGQEGESGSEDENVREVLELLKRGKITNAGPEPAATLQVDSVASSSTSRRADDVSPTSIASEVATISKPRPPVSRIKSAFSDAQSQSPSNSLPDTPVSHADRSSPKVSVGDGPVMNSPSFRGTGQISHAVEDPQEPFQSVVESPSFPFRGARQTDRPPVIVSSQVQESSQAGRSSDFENNQAISRPKKVSRFLAERK